jgi:three-Cys-motif partner protein
VPETKHEIVRRFIHASAPTRRKWLGPRGGGSAFIDLYAGPGRGRVRETKAFVAGSPLIALQHDTAPFTHVVVSELSPVNVAALRERTAADAARVHISQGDCNTMIDEMVSRIPRRGLNLALVDPYGLKALSFETLKKLASFEWMDMIIHFPTGAIKRNWKSAGPWLDRFLGTEDWRTGVTDAEHAGYLVKDLTRQLAALGYTGDAVRAVPVENSINTRMYHLVFASKSKHGDKLWNAVTKNLPGRELSLF